MQQPAAGELRDWYRTADGARAARLIAAAAAPHLGGERLLALGYAAPVAQTAGVRARTLAAVQTSADGAHRWPLEASVSVVASVEALPFHEALFDTVLAVHALEFAERPRVFLRELWRVLAPAGRLVLVVPNRAGVWTHFESTPFGRGQPYGKNTLVRTLADAMFEVTLWRGLLAAPPLRGLRWLDRPLVRVAPRIGGVHLVVAQKTDGLAPMVAGRVATAPLFKPA
jgi:SAM-dependent methyltransferase